VILGVEKRVTSTLLETSSVEKIVEIDRHIGCAMSGLQADARSMVEHARVESQNHAFNYNEPLRVESCTQAICDLALRFGEGAEGEESIMSRPFGVALLIAGYDEDGPSLYVIYQYDPTCLAASNSRIGTTQNRPALSTATTPKPSDLAPRVHKQSCRTSSTSRSLCPRLRFSCSRR
jgi:20S proteasome subunit alpha 5